MISAATSRRGRVVQGSSQAASRKAKARQMLAAVSMAWIARQDDAGPLLRPSDR